MKREYCPASIQYSESLWLFKRRDVALRPSLPNESVAAHPAVYEYEQKPDFTPTDSET